MFVGGGRVKELFCQMAWDNNNHAQFHRQNQSIVQWMQSPAYYPFYRYPILLWSVAFTVLFHDNSSMTLSRIAIC